MFLGFLDDTFVYIEKGWKQGATPKKTEQNENERKSNETKSYWTKQTKSKTKPN